jgi:hypothetical protein
MADQDPPQKVKDLLKSGNLEEHEPAAESFGERVMRRHLRRPAGNSERLWKKVDGTDPWDLPAPPKPDKQRGVWAAGRFVRMDQEESRKADAASHIPDWARKQADQPRQPKAAPEPERAPAPAPAAKVDPQEKIKEIIARKQAEADAQTRAAAAARAASAPPPSATAEAPPAPVVPIGARQASMSKSGRVRTHNGGSFDPTAPVAPVTAPEPEPKHRYAAGRAPPPPRAKPVDLPVEMRTPPKIDPNAPAAPAAPVQHRYAAGREAPAPRKPPKDIPLEQRMPPRVGQAAAAAPAPSAPKYAAGREAPPPRKAPKDLPLEQRMPPRIGPDGQPLPPSSPPKPAEPASADAAPSLPAPRPAPEPGAPPPSNNASLDDLFGLANEGRVRIGRRAKKDAAPAAEEPKKEG